MVESLSYVESSSKRSCAIEKVARKSPSVLSTWKLRLPPARTNGFVVETAQASSYRSFDHFKEVLNAIELDLSRFGAEVAVGYVTPSGDSLQFRFPEDRVLNDQPVNLESMPLFQGPFLNGDAGRLVVTHGPDELVIQP